MPTPVNVLVLAQFLQYYDEQEKDFILSGFSNGFSVCSEKISPSLQCKNLCSANKLRDILSEKIYKELLAGRFAGPFLTPPFSNFTISPLGLCPKKDPKKFRLIHHLSFPKGDSVNDSIAEEFCSVQYTKIIDAIRGIKEFKSPCFLAKTDISMAYRNLPLRPEEYHLFGFMWKGLYYHDKCLPMGVSSACQIFERFSTGLHWIGQNFMNEGITFHILDDFLIVAQSRELCESYLKQFLDVCDKIGVPMAPDKTVGPSHCLTFLGIELDTVEQEARLPSDKLSKCIELIQEFLRRKKVTLREIQSLCGLLNFACQVVLPGRAFLRRLYEITKTLRKPHHTVKLTRGCKDDLLVWQSFLEHFNGTCFFIDERMVSNDVFQLYTDASGTYGYGAVFGKSWFYGEWNEQWLSQNITVKELFPIVWAIEVWGNQMANRSICFNCDNEALVHVLNKQSSTEKNVMFLIRRLVLLSLQYNVLFSAIHLPGKLNILSDALSRLQISKFQKLMPDADPEPTLIPHLPILPV